ncbi:hypothetical protein ADUPG1_011771 [Aduncisulcus paluster]|uniref:Uncharacterized protein n=1 Tax=Aduncisulcus paluster TaxID=2918883 RepID=A0ABQ5JX35_9EUKA|nr:hypothetical protein ADUPG1_011771 [Aduncisulcus paluster]
MAKKKAPPLEREQNRKKEYTRQKNALKKSISRKKSILKEKQKNIDEVEALKTSILHQIDGMKKLGVASRDEMGSIAQETGKITKRLRDEQVVVTNLEKELRLAEEERRKHQIEMDSKYAELQAFLDSHHSSIHDIKQESATRIAEISGKLEKAEIITNQHATAEKTLAIIKEKCASMASVIEKAEEGLAPIRQEIASESDNLYQLKEKEKTVGAECETLKTRVEQKMTDFKKLSEKLLAKRAEEEKIAKKSADLEKQLASLQSSLKDILQHHIKMAKELTAVHQTRKELQNRIQELKAIDK